MRSALSLALIAAAFSIVGCNTDTAPSASVNNWNDLKSSWGETSHFTGDSPTAQAAMAFYTGATTSTVTSIAHFDIFLQSVVVNSDGTQTWNYVVTQTASGPGFITLDHVDFSFPNCTLPDFSDLGGGVWVTDSSVSSCVSGDVIKDANFGFSSGGVYNYSFTTAHAYNVGSITAVIKYGGSCGTGAVPGPDCTSPVTSGGPTTSGGCPPWLSTLILNVDITYSGHHGFTGGGFPIYYLGDTMTGDLQICNPTTNLVDNLTVTAIQETYPAGSMVACGTPVQTWTSVSIAPNDCLILHNTFYLDPACPWGNYQTHVSIVRDADAACPSAALLFEDQAVGVYDPPAGG